MSERKATPFRLVLSLFLTVATIMGLIVSNPNPAYALGVTIGKEAGPAYPLGQTITFTASVQLSQGEFQGINKVLFRTQGPQPLEIELPVAQGNYNLTSNLPKDGQQNPLGTLTATVVWQNVTMVNGYGYGYGYYGYMGETGGGQINYTLQYTPPVLRYPAIADLPSLNNPVFAFDIPGGGAEEEVLVATLLYEIPGVPGAPPGSKPLGLDKDEMSGALVILVDGTGNDIVLRVDPYSGYIFDFIDTGLTNARGVTVFNNDIYVVYGTPNNTRVKKVLNVSGPSPEGLDEIGPLSPTIGNLNAEGLDMRDDVAHLVVSYLQTDPGQGILIRVMNPVTGLETSVFSVPAGPSGGGFKSIVYRPSKDDLIGAYQNKLVMFDKNDGFIFETKEISGVTGLDVEGLALSGDDLFVADGNSKAIYVVSLGAGGGPVGGPPFPRAMAAGGGELFVVVDASPNDKIMRIQPSGVKLEEFSAPGADIESLTYLASSPGKLYMVQNGVTRALWRVDPATKVATKVADLPNWVQEIGGLAESADGTSLIAAERWYDTLHFINPQTGVLVNTLMLMANPPAWLPGGLESLTLMQTPGGAELLGGKWNNFFRINPQNGQITATIMVNPGMPPWDTTGLATLGSSVYIADAGTQQVFMSGVPGAESQEKTTAGDYQARLEAQAVGLAPVLSAPTLYTLTKIVAPDLTITQPAEGTAFTTGTILVKGTVNDPTIHTVSVGVALPTTTLFESNVEEGATELNANWSVPGVSPDVKWHVSPLKKIGTKSWRYGNVSDVPPLSYDTPGQPNSGNLETKSMTFGAGTTLEFYTWYFTEPGFDFDRKLIQVVLPGGTQTIAQIIDFFPPPLPGQPWQPTLPGTTFTPAQLFLGGQPPPGMPPLLIFVPNNLTGAPGEFPFTKVTLDLSQFAGQAGKVRFRFDTVDAWMNDFEGWYIDNVKVQGAGFAGETANVGSDLKWQAQFTLAEGQNSIQAQAVRSAYPPVVTLTKSVNVFLDSAAPVVTISPVTSPTNNPAQTVTGSFVESTANLLEMYVNSKLVMTEKTFTGSTFSKSITLTEGSNDILAKLTDKGGLTGQDTATILLDTTAPTITALSTSYPTGEVSARPNDFFLMQARALDTGTGVSYVKALTTAGLESQVTQNWTNAQKAALAAGQEVTVGDDTYQKVGGVFYRVRRLMARSEIPAAILSQWGIATQATHIMPMSLPSAVPPGQFTIKAMAVDAGGNASTTVDLAATVVSTLSKFNIYLLPNWNLISLPLIPDNTAASTILSGLPAGSLHSVWYYDRQLDAWVSYVPGAPSNSLSEMGTGEGYWVRMNPAAFSLSAPLAPGLPQTPEPIKLTISGIVLKPGELPPTYPTYAGWNLVGLHAERAKQVTIALKSLTSVYGADLWASILEYQNFISFPTTEGAEPEVVLGAFKNLGAGDSMAPGVGYWLYVTQSGYSIVP